MTRFSWTTLGTACAVTIAALTSHGLWRLGILGVILAAYLTLLGLGVAFINLRFFCDSLCRAKTADKRVALTFDDGPDPIVTPRILDVLRQHEVGAVFFCIGKKALARPDLVRRIEAEGHIVGNHSFHHGWWNNFLLGPWLYNEISRCQEAVYRATGTRPVYFRSPAGLTNMHLPRALRKLKLVSVGWDVRTFDRRARDPQSVVNRVRDKVRAGSIIALHDGGVSPDTETAIVAGMITALRSQGYVLLRLDEMTGIQS